MTTLSDVATILKFGVIGAGVAGAGLLGYTLYKKIEQLDVGKKLEQEKEKIKEKLSQAGHRITQAEQQILAQAKQIEQKITGSDVLTHAYQQARARAKWWEPYSSQFWFRYVARIITRFKDPAQFKRYIIRSRLPYPVKNAIIRSLGGA